MFLMRWFCCFETRNWIKHVLSTQLPSVLAVFGDKSKDSVLVSSSFGHCCQASKLLPELRSGGGE